MEKSNGLKRYLCLAQAFALILVSMLTLISCGNTSESTEPESFAGTVTVPETVAETEDPDQTLDVPDVNYNGYTFRVFSAKHESLYTMLDVEKITSEPVNDAIYERNRIIEDRFGIKFECEGDAWTNMYGHLSLQVNSGTSGTDGYDLIMLNARDAYKAALNNYLLPYDRLEHVNIEKDYYFRSINDKYRLGEHTFFAFGKDNINVMGFSCGLIYNKKLAEDIHVENLYDTVRNQAWTYDKMFAYAELAVSEDNGDGKFELGVDTLGMIGHFDVSVPAFWISAGEYLVEKDGNNMPVSNMSGNQRLIDIMQESLNHLDSNAYSVLALGEVYNAFKQDKALFLVATIHFLHDLRSMETDYGVLPFPKYDAAQEDYITRSVDGWLHCVPTTCQNTEMTSIIMQALAYYSNQTVYDAYYEQALTSKFMRDSDSVEMVELMLSTLQVDLGDTIWYEQIRGPIVEKMISQGKETGLASLFKSYQRKANSEIKKVESFLDKQGE